MSVAMAPNSSSATRPELARLARNLAIAMPESGFARAGGPCPGIGTGLRNPIGADAFSRQLGF